MNRRSVLRAIGLGAASAPIAGKAMAEEAAKALSGMGSGGVPHSSMRDVLFSGGRDINPIGPIDSVQAQTTDWNLVREMRDRAIRAALDTPARRGELEDVLYQQHNRVWSLDHDIAGKFTWSLAAKITYQRQRNVQGMIDDVMLQKSFHRQVNDWRDRVLSFAGIKI